MHGKRTSARLLLNQRVTSVDDWYRISAEAEARRICDQSGITDYETYQQMVRSVCCEGYRRSIQPFVQQKVQVHALRIIAKIIIKDDGTIEHIEYQPLPAQAEEYLKTLDELVASEAKKWGLTDNS